MLFILIENGRILFKKNMVRTKAPRRDAGKLAISPRVILPSQLWKLAWSWDEEEGSCPRR